jgi:hypothetical protein
VSDSPRLPPADDPLGDLIVNLVRRATVPFGDPDGGRPATAFLYNHLIETRDDGDLVVEHLVTATAALAVGEVGALRIRPDMVQPSGAAADALLVPSFADQWTLAGDVAFMVTVGLHQHARRKGWSWDTQEVTDGLAATAADVEVAGAGLGYVVGHGVNESGRPLSLLRGGLSRAADGTVHWGGSRPSGLVGAPVLAPRPVGEGGVKVVCLGVLLPDGRVATFDVIRVAVEQSLPPGLHAQ